MFGSPSFGTSTFGQPQQQQSTGLFGTTTQPTFSGFGQPQQQQSTGLFGTTTQPSFGTSTFGQPKQQQSAGLFGTTTAPTFSGFGQPQQQQSSQSTGLFGTTTQPTFSGFGQPKQQQSTGLFGTTIAPTFSGFGQPQQQQSSQSTGLFGTTTQPTFSGFGQPQQQQSSQSTGLFGTTTQPTFSGFGQPKQQQSTGLFGTTIAPTFSGFGQPSQPQQQQSTGLFGTTTQPTFSGFGQPQQQTSLFGTTSTGLVQPQQQSATTGLLGAPAFGSGALGQQQSSSLFQPLQTQQPSLLTQQQPTFTFQPQQQSFQLGQLQQPQQQQVEDSHAFYQSIFQCHKFGDERDAILANLNYLQAGWGQGKGHYSQTFPPVTYTTSNPFYRFKAVSYAFIQTENNEDGHVTFDIKKPEEKVRQEEANLITALQNMIGRPNIFFKVSRMKRKEPEITMVNLFAEDKTTLRRIPATDLTNALLQPHLKVHLDNLMIENVVAKIRPSPEQLKRYLEDAPQGLDPRVWKQAQEDNPDPEHMIPVPIIGIDALKKRAVLQESESHQHVIRLDLMEEDITALQNRHTNMTAELQQLKRKQCELAHRILKVVLRLEVTRKDGTTIQPEEEELSKLLVSLEEKLSTPAEFRGKLNELISRARLKLTEESGVRYSLDDATLSRIKNFLQTQQESIQSVQSTVHADMDQLKLISESLNDLAFSPNVTRQYSTGTFD